VKRSALTAVLVGAAFLAGSMVGQEARAARRDGPYRPLDVFSRALEHILNLYVDEVPEKELVYGAIDGMVAKLDPHSTFLRPDLYRQLKEDTSGEFDGVGLELSSRGEQLVVVAPIADSPGERAGILPGDQILEIDGVSTRDMALVEAVRRLKGAPGTRVVLRIQREGFTAPQALTVLRDLIRTRSVDWNVADRERGLAHVRIRAFQDRTERALKRALDDARGQLGREIQGLVLDLRNNPGGLLDQAVRVSDRFLREGIIVTTEGRGQANREEERAHERDTEPGYPIVVLVNRGSASASEIVAGALQDHKRGVIMGTQTFGKGSVQTIIDLPDGSGLKLTNARYFTPKHRSIHEQGITPDVVVADAPAPGAGPAGADFQLRSALDYLRGSAAPRVQAGAAGARR